jgi:IS5 family transposase
LSDDNAEYTINDRLSLARKLFDKFNAALEKKGIITRKDSIIDASFVDAPRQHNTPDDNKTIKEGKVPEDWQKPENVHKSAQKDTDARWAKKGDEVHYGFKDNVKIDRDSKVITEFTVTSANVHDVKEFENLLNESDSEVWADAGYAGKEIAETLLNKYPTLKLHVCEKGRKNNPLTDEQKTSNREKSRVRARVEHVFGYMTRFMADITVRGIGIARAKRDICNKNLAYNLKRAAFLATAMPVWA